MSVKNENMPNMLGLNNSSNPSVFRKCFKLLAIYLFLMSLGAIAMWPPKALSHVLTLLFSVITLISIAGLFRLRDTKPLKISILKILRLLFKVWSLQAGFFLFIMLLFHTLELSANENSRLQSIIPGTLFLLVHEKYLLLGLFPNLLFASIGIAFAYFAQHGKTPSFARLLVHRIHDPKTFFFNNYFNVISNAVVLWFCMLMASITTLWIANEIGNFLGTDNLFKYALRTFFISFVIVLVTRKYNRSYLEWTERNRIPLGSQLIIYVTIVAGLLLLVQGICQYFASGLEQYDPSLIVKSALAGSFTEIELKHRFILLILGCWIACFPWMTSYYASIALLLKQRSWITFIGLNILPISFFFMIQKITSPQIQFIFEGFTSLGLGLPIAMFFAFVLWWLWRRVITLEDLARGEMPPLGQARPYSLNHWLKTFLLVFSFYTPSFVVWGWFLVQVIGTLIAILLLTCLIPFVFWLLFAGGSRHVAEVKHKLQDAPLYR